MTESAKLFCDFSNKITRQKRTKFHKKYVTSEKQIIL